MGHGDLRKSEVQAENSLQPDLGEQSLKGGRREKSSLIRRKWWGRAGNENQDGINQSKRVTCTFSPPGPDSSGSPWGMLRFMRHLACLRQVGGQRSGLCHCSEL